MAISAMSASADTYFQSLRGIVTTQTTTDRSRAVSTPISLQNMCANERKRSSNLLDHIELASILTTQLCSKSEAILLRERVLRDAVAEKDELIHCRIEEGQEGFLTAGNNICFVGRVLWTRAGGRFPRLPPSSGPTLQLILG
jgi:hypothetical protein